MALIAVLDIIHEETKRDLLAFLDALNGEGWQNIQPPAEFPK